MASWYTDIPLIFIFLPISFHGTLKFCSKIIEHNVGPKSESDPRSLSQETFHQHKSIKQIFKLALANSRAALPGTFLGTGWSLGGMEQDRRTKDPGDAISQLLQSAVLWPLWLREPRLEGRWVTPYPSPPGVQILWGQIFCSPAAGARSHHVCQDIPGCTTTSRISCPWLRCHRGSDHAAGITVNSLSWVWSEQIFSLWQEACDGF